MKICKKFYWDAAHTLVLPYESKCNNKHGHTYTVEIEVEGTINDLGMVMDFSRLKAAAEAASFDHQDINELNWFKTRDINPTAEHLVLYLYDIMVRALPEYGVHLSRIRVWETQTSWAEETWPFPILSYAPVDIPTITVEP